jgi:cytochrome c oxidase subunit IV
VGVLSAYWPFPKAASLVVIFGAALVKAVLVAANDMHLRFEPRLIYAIAMTPLLLFA